MAEDLSIRVIRDYPGIEEIRGVWTSWQRHPNSDIDFYITIMRSLPGVIRPHVLVLYQEGAPRAILVGRLEHGQINVKFGYKNLLRAKARLLTFIYGGFLGDTSSENAKILVQEIISALGRKEADAAMLSNVEIDSPLYRFGRELSWFLSRDYGITLNMHRSMSLPGSAGEVYQRFSGKVRKNLKWQARKLVQDFSGALRIRTFRKAAEFDEMMRDVEELAKKTYQRGLGVGFVDSREMRERLELEARKGWMRAFILYLGDKPCAFWIGTQYQGKFYSAFMGYDRDYGKYSPGMFLIMKVIEGFCQASDGDRPQLIDFGFGDAQYKAVLADSSWSESSVYLFAPTIKGIGLNLLRTPTAMVNKVATTILGKTSLLPRIKRIWRDRVRKN